MNREYEIKKVDFEKTISQITYSINYLELLFNELLYELDDLYNQTMTLEREAERLQEKIEDLEHTARDDE